jgi:hypothetical protein
VKRNSPPASVTLSPRNFCGSTRENREIKLLSAKIVAQNSLEVR